MFISASCWLLAECMLQNKCKANQVCCLDALAAQRRVLLPAYISNGRLWTSSVT